MVVCARGLTVTSHRSEPVVIVADSMGVIQAGVVLGWALSVVHTWWVWGWGGPLSEPLCCLPDSDLQSAPRWGCEWH